MSNSLWPRGLWPARLLCPWNFPGKSTGVGCHFLLLKVEKQVMYLSFNIRDAVLLSRKDMFGHFSRVQLFAALWIVTRQLPLSMGFSRQEYWSGLPCPPGDLSLGLNPHLPCLLHWRWILCPLSHLGSPSCSIFNFCFCLPFKLQLIYFLSAVLPMLHLTVSPFYQWWGLFSPLAEFLF